jgi:SMI1-KNR4 cell-wall
MYEWIYEAISESNQIFKQLSLDWNFHMQKGASKEEIAECEKELGLSLPLSYKEFILKHNGAYLFFSDVGTTSSSNSWWADSGVILFGTRALKEYKPLIYDSFLLDDDSCTDDYQSILPIAYLGRLMSGDFCALSLDRSVQGEYPVLDCNRELPASDWKRTIIADSIDTWLRGMFERVIKDKSFPEYWIHDDIKLDRTR